MLSANQNAQKFLNSLEYAKRFAPFVGIATTAQKPEDLEPGVTVFEQGSIEDLLEHHRQIVYLETMIDGLHATMHTAMALRAVMDPNMLEAIKHLGN